MGVSETQGSLTWPNFISVCRVAAVPLFVIFLAYDHRTAAFVTFLAAGVSDALDGFLARVLNQRSTLGTYLDPLADKLLAATGFFTGALFGFIPVWLAIVVVSRDLIISLGALVVYVVQGSLVIAPLPLGKITTFVQFSTLAAVLASHLAPMPEVLLIFLFAGTASLCVVSGVQYVHVGLRAVGSEK